MAPRPTGSAPEVARPPSGGAPRRAPPPADAPDEPAGWEEAEAPGSPGEDDGWTDLDAPEPVTEPETWDGPLDGDDDDGWEEPEVAPPPPEPDDAPLDGDDDEDDGWDDLEAEEVAGRVLMPPRFRGALVDLGITDLPVRCDPAREGGLLGLPDPSVAGVEPGEEAEFRLRGPGFERRVRLRVVRAPAPRVVLGRAALAGWAAIDPARA